MNTNRRQFLQSLGALVLLPVTGNARAEYNEPAFISNRADHMGRYYFTAADNKGRVMFGIALPGRGHGVTFSPDQQYAAIFARRPGDFLYVVNLYSGKVEHRLYSKAQRHFFGHGVYSHDGRWLYTTENNLATDQGVIAVRDAHNRYKQVNEFPTHGIGPHELRLMSNGDTLVIANGGIKTRPETGRSKLNLDSMQPSLAYINRHDGKLLGRYMLPEALHKNSIRHLAVNADDTVCMGLQYQGNANDRPLLVAMHQAGKELMLLDTPPAILERMHNYCGSVVADKSGHIFAVSSPRGGLVTFWSAETLAFLGHTDISDGCGIAATRRPGEFIISSGDGTLLRYSAVSHQGEILQHPSRARWDNHMG